MKLLLVFQYFKGIFTRFGFFYNLYTDEFEKVMEPPLHPWGGVVNAMWSFRGRPTIFGGSVCQPDGSCKNTRIMQYVPENDDWIELGHMITSRWEY